MEYDNRFIEPERLKQHREMALSMVGTAPTDILLLQLLVTFRTTQGLETDQLRAVIVNELNKRDPIAENSNYQFLQVLAY